MWFPANFPKFAHKFLPSLLAPEITGTVLTIQDWNKRTRLLAPKKTKSEKEKITEIDLRDREIDYFKEIVRKNRTQGWVENLLVDDVIFSYEIKIFLLLDQSKNYSENSRFDITNYRTLVNANSKKISIAEIDSLICKLETKISEISAAKFLGIWDKTQE